MRKKTLLFLEPLADAIPMILVMTDHRLERIRSAVRRGDYELSAHVLAKIEDNEFSLDDVEHSILCGTVAESQRDEAQESVDGRKYTIHGRARSGITFETVGKLLTGEDGNSYFVITAYKWS